MKLLLCKPRGFCAGVVRAIDSVEKALALWGPPIYVKHEIVHNRHVVERLKAKGAIFIEELSSVPPGSRLIYSAHGVSPEVRREAKERSLLEIDATCGLVTKVHSAAKRFAAKGYHILLIGHRNHVEVIGTAGEVPGKCTVIENVEEVGKLSFTTEDRLCYLTQTTLSLDDVAEVTNALLARYPQIETLPSSSICYATTHRQLALKQITSTCDLILVVGDPSSSNSNRLCEISHRQNLPSYLINSPEEMNPLWFKNVKTLGLTAGASTPEDIVEQCIAKLQEEGVKEIEEIVFAQEDVFFQLPKELLAL